LPPLASAAALSSLTEPAASAPPAPPLCPDDFGPAGRSAAFGLVRSAARCVATPEINSFLAGISYLVILPLLASVANLPSRGDAPASAPRALPCVRAAASTRESVAVPLCPHDFDSADRSAACGLAVSRGCCGAPPEINSFLAGLSYSVACPRLTSVATFP